jgi:hypothetical protein
MDDFGIGFIWGVAWIRSRESVYSRHPIYTAGDVRHHGIPLRFWERGRIIQAVADEGAAGEEDIDISI